MTCTCGIKFLLCASLFTCKYPSGIFVSMLRAYLAVSVVEAVRKHGDPVNPRQEPMRCGGDFRRTLISLDFPRTNRVTYGDRAFSIHASKLWNKLPRELKNIKDKKKFKKKLKTHLYNLTYG